MTTLTRPQLASSEIPDIYTQVTWPKYIQPKYDGICCLAVNGVAMSRTMKPIPNKFIQKFFAENNLHGFHGELMVNGDFNDVQSAVMSIDGEPDFYYAVYDLWNHDGTYEQRFWQTCRTVEQEDLMFETGIIVTPTELVCDVEQVEFAMMIHIEQGFEGSMLRCPKSLYKQGRHTLKSQALMKLKTFRDDEARIIGFEERMTNTNEQELDERGYAKRSSKKEGLVGDGTLGALVVRGINNIEFKIGSGYTDAQRKSIWERRNSLLGQIVTFKYQELSAKSVPRFPVFKCIRIPC